LHLASMNEIDPFTLAEPGDAECASVFIRSWMIDPDYLEEYRVLFLQPWGKYHSNKGKYHHYLN
ncbi:MAG: hypothetical protein AAFY21_14510, partial [Cyanobacteria bacterium J06641_2]